MQKVIREEFLTGLLDLLEQYNSLAENDAEKELMYIMVSTLNKNLEFEN